MVRLRLIAIELEVDCVVEIRPLSSMFPIMSQQIHAFTQWPASDGHGTLAFVINDTPYGEAFTIDRPGPFYPAAQGVPEHPTFSTPPGRGYFSYVVRRRQSRGYPG